MLLFKNRLPNNVVLGRLAETCLTTKKSGTGTRELCLKLSCFYCFHQGSNIGDRLTTDIITNVNFS